MTIATDISNLVQLQKVDNEIRAIRSRLDAIPVEIRALEKEIATERANLKTAEEALSEGQKDRRTQEGELAAAEQKVSKYTDQLMNVKSNEEYKAMQKQIDTAKKEVGALEEKILIGMDTIEDLDKERAKRAAELEIGEREISAMEKEIRAEEAKLREELAERERAHKEATALVSEELLDEYLRIASTRSGVAMAEALDEICQVCMVRLRPQVYQELRLGQAIHHCSNCQRFLYYLDEAEKESG